MLVGKILKLRSPEGGTDYARVVEADDIRDHIGVMVYMTFKDAHNENNQQFYSEIYSDQYEAVIFAESN